MIQAIKDRTPFTCQTSAEATAGTNTSASILYNSSSRRQGNFSTFYLEVIDFLTGDLGNRGMALTDAQKTRAYAYLIADLQEKKQNPDWAAKQVSYGGDQLTKEQNKTSYYVAYEQLLGAIGPTASEPIEPGDDDLLMADHENYPDDLRLSNLAEVHF